MLDDMTNVPGPKRKMAVVDLSRAIKLAETRIVPVKQGHAGTINTGSSQDSF